MVLDIQFCSVSLASWKVSYLCCMTLKDTVPWKFVLKGHNLRHKISFGKNVCGTFSNGKV